MVSSYLIKKTSASPHRHNNENMTSSIICPPIDNPIVMIAAGTPTRISKITQPGTGLRTALEEVVLGGFMLSY